MRTRVKSKAVTGERRPFGAPPKVVRMVENIDHDAEDRERSGVQSIGRAFTILEEVGPQNFILATDLGQTGNPSPADGLQLFVVDLMKAGVSKDDIMKMGREVTGKLLMG